MNMMLKKARTKEVYSFIKTIDKLRLVSEYHIIAPFATMTEKLGVSTISTLALVRDLHTNNYKVLGLIEYNRNYISYCILYEDNISYCLDYIGRFKENC